jgi:hypothetical protein
VLDGVNWSERHVAGPFDFNRAPTAEGGLFIGDYQGLASASGEFVAFFAQTGADAADPTDIYASVFHGSAAPARDRAKATYQAVEAKAAPLTPAWQQQVDRIAQKTLSQRHIAPSATAPPRAPALP